MRIVVLEDIPEDPELRRAWNELALRMERPEVFYTHEWAVAVRRAYEDCRRPLLFLAYESNFLVGVVAFAKDQGRTRDVVFLTGSTADYCDFLSAPDRRLEFVEAVLGEMQTRKIDKVVLANLPADSCSVGAISRAAPISKYNLHSRLAYLCARVVLGSGEERSALKKATAGKKRLRRNFRELEKIGPVFVRHDTQWEQIEPILQSLSQAHVARFLSIGRMSNLLSAERRKFLYELARELSSSGWVAVSRLQVGDVPIAWNYGFQFPGSWFWYQPTVESGPTFADFSPGYCLLARIVELACDRPEIEVVDLGLGSEEYKDRFATATRETLYCVLNKSFSDHVQMAVRDRAVALAKRAPAVESWVRVMISCVARLNCRLREERARELLKRVGRRVARFLFAFDEVLFFEWTSGDHKRKGAATLRPLGSDLLGAAAIKYADEPTTIDFLMRSAQRFRCQPDQGFALITADGTPVHFCWVRDFEGFEMQELERTLHAPGKNAAMIFDCFTPVSARGNGLFGEAIGAVARLLREQGKVPWIFGAAADQGSLRGIEKSGFTYRFSLGCRKIAFLRIMKDSISSLGGESATSSATVP